MTNLHRYAPATADDGAFEPIVPLAPANRVAYALAAHGPQTAAELAGRTGLSTARCAAACRTLHAQGRVAGNNERPIRWSLARRRAAGAA
jgi:hypothetical protein